MLTQGGVGGETIRFDEPELSVEPAGVISPLLEGNGRKGGELFAMAKKGSHIVSRTNHSYQVCHRFPSTLQRRIRCGRTGSWGEGGDGGRVVQLRPARRRDADADAAAAHARAAYVELEEVLRRPLPTLLRRQYLGEGLGILQKTWTKSRFSDTRDFSSLFADLIFFSLLIGEGEFYRKISQL